MCNSDQKETHEDKDVAEAHCYSTEITNQTQISAFRAQYRSPQNCKCFCYFKLINLKFYDSLTIKYFGWFVFV